MRILFLTNKPPYPPRDGSSLATSQMITGLNALGHEMHVFYLNTTKHVSHTDRMPPALKDISFTPVYIQTKIRYFPAVLSLLFSGTPYTVSRFINEESRKRLQRLLREHSFDIIQIEGLSMTPYAALLPSAPDIRIVFRPHNTEYVIWQKMAQTEKNPVKKIYFYLLARQIRKYERNTAVIFRAILPISQDDSSQFLTWNPKATILTMPFGVDAPAAKTETDLPGSPTLLFLGSLDWQPNIKGLTWFLTDIWPLITERIPGIKIRIAGRNPDDKLKHIIQKIKKGKGKTSAIDFPGEIDSTEDFFQSGAIFIVPLLAGSGIRIKILEAMARKCAVVSTSTGATGIPVTHSHDILIANHPREFVNAVERLIKDPPFYRKITGNALFLLQKHFDKSMIIRNLENFYRNL
ncbi:MAG: glycosyltransferase family 4 protein [Bacteroidales bacterium]|nr:glycosyltransferase family 4 protein [Bacteroidales bacterium]